jgi:hypothetical protein
MSEHAIAQIAKPAAAVAPQQGGILQRQCACGQHAAGGECEECRKNKIKLQRFASGPMTGPSVPQLVQDEMRAEGQPLDRKIKQKMELFFDHDFSHVRVHSSDTASRSARAVNALAYTVGSHVVFGSGMYAPGSRRGERLLAHELTHVVQQRGGSNMESHSEAPYEDAANRMADEVARHAIGAPSQRPPISSSGIYLARQPDNQGPEWEDDESDPHPANASHSHDEAARKAAAAAKAPPLITKATQELDRLNAVIGPLHPNDTVAAYDAVQSAVHNAKTSGDKALIRESQKLVNRFESIPLPGKGSSRFDQHPAADSKPMTPEEAHRVVLAQRGFAVGLNQQGVDEKRAQIEKKEGELSAINEKLKSAKGNAKKKLRDDAELLQRQIKAGKARIAVSRPTFIEDKPEDLAKEKQKLIAKLAQKGTSLQKSTLQSRIQTIDEQIRALTSGIPATEAPLSALQGGRLGHPGQTYVTIQIITPPPDSKVIRTLQARNDSYHDLHAEDVLLDQLSKMPDQGRFKGATMVIAGDQEVCPRCFPRVREFAKDNGFERAIGTSFHAPIVTPGGKDTGRWASAKTTVGKISDPQQVRKLARGQQAAEQKSGGDQHPQSADSLKFKYKEQSIFRRRPVIQDDPGGHGGTQPGSPTAAVHPSSNASLSTASNAAPKLEHAPTVPAKKPISPAAGSAALSATPAALKSATTAPAVPPRPPARAATAKSAQPSAPAVAAGRGTKSATPSAGPARVKSAPGPKPSISTLKPVASGPAPTPQGFAAYALQPGAGATAATSGSNLQHGGSIISGANQAGVKGSIGGEATRDHGHGVQSTTSANFDGKVVTSVEEVPGTSPRQYRVTLTLNLGGQVGAGASKQGAGGGSFGVSGYAAGSFTKSESHLLSKEEADSYLGAARAGTGGAYQELQIAKMVAHSDIESARRALARWKQGQESAEASRNMHEGDISSGTVQASVGAGLSSSGFKGMLGLELGASKSGELTRTRQLSNGKYLYTVSIVSGTGKTLGGSASVGVASMGYKQEDSQFESRSVTFALDPKDPDFEARVKEIAGADTVEDLRKLAGRRKDLAASTTTGHGTSTMGTTSAGIVGSGFSISQGGRRSHEQTQDASGVSERYEGASTLGGAFNIAGRSVGSSSATDTFVSNVRPDNTATGVAGSVKTESDLGKSALEFAKGLEDRPAGTLVGITTGDTKLLKEKTDDSGKALTDDSFGRLAELAHDPRAWEAFWFGHGDISDLMDWRKTRIKVLAARGDRNLISQALSEYESEGSGRSGVVGSAVGETGIAFDFPDELADQKPIYDELVIGDALGHARDLAGHGESAAAIAELTSDNNRLGSLLDKIGMHASHVSPGALAEMTRRISARRTQLRAEIRKLTPPAAAPPATSVAETPQAAPQVDTAAIEERNRVIEDRNARLTDKIKSCLDLRAVERANFAKIDAEFAKDEHWYSSHDFYEVRHLLDSVGRLYPDWNKDIEDLGAIYKERGEPAERANQFGPDTARKEALESKWRQQ